MDRILMDPQSLLPPCENQHFKLGFQGRFPTKPGQDGRTVSGGRDCIRITHDQLLMAS